MNNNYSKLNKLEFNILILFNNQMVFKQIKKYFGLFFIVVTNSITAQEQVANILPPSMDNYNFTKYGGIDLNGNSGGFSYSVPFYNVNYGNIAIPISLSYYTDGVKVNDIAGIAGMNWNLMAGGMITRVVKDEPDEYNTTIKFRPEGLRIVEIIQGNYDDAYYVANMKEDAMKLWNSTYNSSGVNHYNKIDTEQDVFSFNFNGISGNFYIENSIIYLDTDDNGIKASFIKSGTGTAPVLEFTFITPDGKIYIFGGATAFIESSEVTGGCSKNFTQPIPTTWHLKSIENHNNLISFEYENSYKQYSLDYSQSVTYKQSEIDRNCNIGVTVTECATHFNSVNGKVLKQINFGTSKVIFSYLDVREDYSSGRLLKEIVVNDGVKDIEKIVFDYVFSLSTSTNVPNYNAAHNKKRAFLKKIIFKNNTFQEFEYNNMNGLSPRLSYSQDIYGYNNANTLGSLLNVNYDGEENKGLKTLMKRNFSDIDRADRSVDQQKSLYGVLNKIVYPTKGYTVVKYENNKNIEIKRVTKWATENYHLSKTNCQPRITEYPVKKIFNFISNGSDIHIYANASTDRCPGVYVDEFHDKHSVVIRNKTTGALIHNETVNFNERIISDESIYLNTRANFIPIKTVLGNTYSVEYIVTSKFNNIFGSMDLKYNSYSVLEPTAVNYSGARVSSITDFDFNHKSYNEKKYVYNDILNLTTGKTSLHHNYYFSPWSFDCARPSCQIPTELFTDIDCNNIINFGSNNNLSNYSSRGKRINYGAISTILFDNSVVENKYIVNRDPEEPILIHRLPIKNASRSNEFEWSDGKISETNIYKFVNNAHQPVKNISYNYAVLSSIKFHNYNTELGVVSPNQFIGMNLDKVINFVSYQGCITLICNLRERLKVDQYFNYCRTRAKTEITEKEFFDGQELVRKTTMNFNSPYHKFMSSQTTTDSKGQNIINTYLYAPDIEMQFTPFRNELIAKNIIGAPLKSGLSINGGLLSEKLITFDTTTSPNGLLLPKFMYAAKFPNELPSISGIGNLEKKISYDLFDDKANLLQYTPEGGLTTVLIWGYNRTQPIVKIENSSYSQINQYVGNLQTLSNGANEQGLITAFNNLRTVLPATAMITTYTYKPLVGISSITDPKGDRQTYHYDEFNRLEFVKDSQGNILSESKYHYKN